MSRKTYAALSGAILILVVGCTERKDQGPRMAKESGPAAHRPSDARLRERADALWAARVKKDCNAQFQFQEPSRRAHSRESEFVEWCQSKSPFLYESYKIGKSPVDGDMGWIELDYMARVRRFEQLPARDAKQWEKWHIVDGEWYPIAASDQMDYPESPTLRDLADETKLHARVTASWNARISQDWETFYNICDPKTRESITLDKFVEEAQRRAFLDYKIDWCEAMHGAGRARVIFQTKVNDPNMKKLPADTKALVERWVKIENEWFLWLAPPQGS